MQFFLVKHPSLDSAVPSLPGLAPAIPAPASYSKGWTAPPPRSRPSPSCPSRPHSRPSPACVDACVDLCVYPLGTAPRRPAPRKPLPKIVRRTLSLSGLRDESGAGLHGPVWRRDVGPGRGNGALGCRIDPTSLDFSPFLLLYPPPSSLSPPSLFSLPLHCLPTRLSSVRARVGANVGSAAARSPRRRALAATASCSARPCGPRRIGGAM